MVDTIPKKDVSQEAGDEVAPAEPRQMTEEENPKRAGLADIYGKRRTQIEDELNEERDPELARLTLKDEEPEPDPDLEPGEGEGEGEGEDEPGKDAAPDPAAKDPAKAEDPPADPELMITVTHEGKTFKVPASSVKVPVKVNQQDREITGVEAVTGFQMSAAGQEKLREANRRLQEAYKIEQRNKESTAAKPAADPAVAPAAAPSPTKEAVDALPDDTVTEMARKLQYGDEKEAADVIREISKRVGQGVEPVDIDEIANQVANRVTEIVDEKNRRTADLQETQKAYPEIFQDQALTATAINFVHQIRAKDLTDLGYDLTGTNVQQWADQYRIEQQRGTVRTDRDLFKEAAESTKKWVTHVATLLGDPAPAKGDKAPATASAPAPASNVHKLESKRKAGAQPKAATGFQPGEAPPPKPKTGREIVAEMKAARKQPA